MRFAMAFKRLKKLFFGKKKKKREIRTHDQGVKFIQSFEALKLKAYKDSVGVWTIGWGHTRDVEKGDRITEEEAEKFIVEDIKVAEADINRFVEVELSENEFSALTSWVFNLGGGNLKTSTMLRRLNEGKKKEAANEMLRWDKAKVDGRMITLRGLTRRREAERIMFLTED